MRGAGSGARRLVVAAFLSLFLGACGGPSDTPVATESPTGTPDRTVELLGTDALTFSPASTAALPGRIEVTLTSGPSVRHNVVFEDVDEDAVVVDALPGMTDMGDVELNTGTYTYYCAIPGHRAAGMEGTLVVTE